MEFIMAASDQPAVLCIGLACVDFVNVVESYPEEDSLARATSQTVRRGGNASNTACVLSTLGVHTGWMGSLGVGPMADLVIADLAAFGVVCCECSERCQEAQPTAHIVSSKSSGSRTVVLHNMLPDLSEVTTTHRHV